MRHIVAVVLAALSYTAMPALAQAGPTLGPKVIGQTRSVLDTLVGPVKYRPRGKWTNGTIQGNDATCSGYCIRLADGSRNVTIRGNRFQHNGDPSKISAAIAITDADGVLIEGNTIDIIATGAAKGYANRDGYMLSAGAKNITVRGGIVRGATDRAFDSKSLSLRIEDITFDGNPISLSNWGRAEVVRMTSRNPVKGHVQAQPGDARTGRLPAYTHVGELNVAESVPTTLVGVGKGTTTIIDRCTGKRFPGGRDVYYQEGATPANTVVRLGPGCQAR